MTQNENNKQINDGSFLVRAPKELIKQFSEIAEQESYNRSALLRSWVQRFVDGYTNAGE